MNKADILHALNQHVNSKFLDPLDPHYKEMIEIIDKNGGVIPSDLPSIDTNNIVEADIARLFTPKGDKRVFLDIMIESRGSIRLAQLLDNGEQNIRVGLFDWVIRKREAVTWAVAKFFPKFGGEAEQQKIKENILGSHKAIRDTERLGKTGIWKITFVGEDFPDSIQTESYGRKRVEKYMGTVKFCVNCLLYSHTKKFCRVQKAACYNCGRDDGHTEKECEHAMYCKHCNVYESHRAVDKHMCPKYAEMKQSHQRRIVDQQDKLYHLDQQIKQVRHEPNQTPPYQLTQQNYPSLISETTKQQQRIAQLEKDNKNLHTLIEQLQTQNSHKQQNTDKTTELEETIKRIVKEEVAKQTEEVSKRLVLLETTLCALGDKIKALVDTAAGLQKGMQKKRIKTPKATPTSSKRARLSPSLQSSQVIRSFEDGSSAGADPHVSGVQSNMQTPKSSQNTHAE